MIQTEKVIGGFEGLCLFLVCPVLVQMDNIPVVYLRQIIPGTLGAATAACKQKIFIICSHHSHSCDTIVL